MKTFQWMFVDDKESDRKFAEKLNELLKGELCVKIARPIELVLHCFSNSTHAVEATKKYRFNLAIVDWHLKQDDRDGGLEILRGLAKRQPNSTRIIRSQYSLRGIRELQPLLDPTNTVIQSAFNTESTVPLSDEEFRASQIYKYIFNLAFAWLENAFDVSLPDDLSTQVARITKSLGMKGLEGWDVNLTREVIAFLLSMATGQSDRLVSPTSHRVESLEITTLTRGASRAIVIATRPVFEDSDHNAGNWLVHKIDLIDDIREEYSRFRQFIRNRVASERRVEMVFAAEDNHLGIITYTYAGNIESTVESQLRIRSLRDVFLECQKEDSVDSCNLVLTSIYGKPDLHKTNIKGQPLNNYFNDRFGNAGGEFLDTVHYNLGSLVNTAHNGETFIVFANGPTSIRVSSPRELFHGTVFRDTVFPFCLSHGDLHSENVIVDSSNDCVLIDYRQTGPAPRCIDFVVMDASIRLILDAETAWDSAIAREKALAAVIWDHNGPSATLPWQSVSQKLAELRTSTFNDSLAGPVSREEYSAVALYWCYNLLRIQSIRRQSKQRLLAWCEVLRPCCSD